MTETEKQAIFKLREIIDYDKKHRLETIYDKEQIEFRNNIELVLDLVEKLQKEFITKQEVKDNYIPKDLVIKKIQEQNEKIRTYIDCLGY